MTIATTAASIRYSGNGTTTAFATGFAFFAADELVVTSIAADGTASVLTRGTHYTVAGGSGANGTVTYVTAPASGVTVSIRRNTSRTQSQAFSDYGPFPARAVEAAYDRLNAADQELAEGQGRGIRMPSYEAATVELPGKAERSGRLMGFDPDGSPVAVLLSTLPTVLPNGPVNVRTLGATGDGTTDDWVALQAALDLAVLTGSTVALPAGTYRSSKKLTALGLRGIEGGGKEASIIVFDTVANGGMELTFNNDRQFCTIDGICLRQTERGGTALLMDYSALDLAYPGQRDRFVVRNVRFDGVGAEQSRGWDIGCDSIAGAYGKIVDCDFIGFRFRTDADYPVPNFSLCAYRFRGTGDTFDNGHPVVCYVDRCSAYNVVTGALFQSCEGAYARGNTFVEVNIGVAFVGQTITHPHFVCLENHMNCYLGGVYCSELVDGIVRDNVIYRIQTATLTTIGIHMSASAGFAGNGTCQICGNHFFDLVSSSMLDAVRVEGAGGSTYSSVIIDDNIFRFCRTAITLGAGSLSCVVGPGNIFGVVTTTVIDSGSGNRIAASGFDTASGFDRAISGVEQKWGSAVVALDASGDGSITFPEPFPTAFLNAVVSPGDGAFVPGTPVAHLAGCTRFLLNVAVRPNPGAVNMNIAYQATGY